MILNKLNKILYNFYEFIKEEARGIENLQYEIILKKIDQTQKEINQSDHISDTDKIIKFTKKGLQYLSTIKEIKKGNYE